MVPSTAKTARPKRKATLSRRKASLFFFVKSLFPVFFVFVGIELLVFVFRNFFLQQSVVRKPYPFCYFLVIFVIHTIV